MKFKLELTAIVLTMLVPVLLRGSPLIAVFGLRRTGLPCVQYYVYGRESLYRFFVQLSNGRTLPLILYDSTQSILCVEFQRYPISVPLGSDLPKKCT